MDQNGREGAPLPPSLWWVGGSRSDPPTHHGNLVLVCEAKEFREAKPKTKFPPPFPIAARPSGGKEEGRGEGGKERWKNGKTSPELSSRWCPKGWEPHKPLGNHRSTTHPAFRTLGKKGEKVGGNLGLGFAKAKPKPKFLPPPLPVAVSREPGGWYSCGFLMVYGVPIP